MARVCSLCGKKINIFESIFFLGKDEYPACSACEKAYDTVNFGYSKNPDQYPVLKQQFLSQFNNSEVAVSLIEEIDRKYNEMLSSQQEKEQEQKEMQEKAELEKEQEKQETINQEKEKIKLENQKFGPFDGDMIYSVDGVRGRHIAVYKDRCIITTKVTLGSLIAHNATDGEKTIYYSDCIGVQFKLPGVTIGYLQLETASSCGNNHNSNYFDENSFTFDGSVISNEKMTEIADYVKKCIAEAKQRANSAPQTVQAFSVADELLKLKQLLDLGVLTQEEFDSQKAKLLQ